MADQDDRPACKYGVNCYQRNQAHKDRFSHPPKDPPASSSENQRRSPSVEPPAKRRKSSSQPDSNSDTEIEEKNVPTPSEDHESTSNGRSSNGSSSNGNSSNGSSFKKDVATSEPTVEKTPTKHSTSIRCSEKSPHAQREEYQKLLDSPGEFISSKFLVKMPDDFFEFWSFCESESKNSSKPQNLFNKFGLSLVGPFDILAKKFHSADSFAPGDYLRHWRFYYDPPEFQTIMVKDKSGIHYGYWRDEPDGECLIARNDANKNCEFTFIADNIFGAVLYFLEKEIQLSPFNKSAGLASIENFAHSKNISLTSFPAKLKSRNLKTVRKTDIGYRQLGESDANLKKILNKIMDAKGDLELITVAMDKLQPLITAANIACDESDFGSAIELGTDLFCFGAPELHSDALQLLATGYKLVNKPQFIAIAKAHQRLLPSVHSGTNRQVKQINMRGKFILLKTILSTIFYLSFLTFEFVTNVVALIRLKPRNK